MENHHQRDDPDESRRRVLPRFGPQEQAILLAFERRLPRGVLLGNLMPFITHIFTSRDQLIQAVDEYVVNPSVFCYRIGLWDVSQITDFSHVFDARRNRALRGFNEDLSGWDVSTATDLSYMFMGCTSFNSDVASWNVSNATNLNGMFDACTSFNSDISSWNVSNASHLDSTFHGCTSFNRDVSSWNVSNATSFYCMFYGCTSFNRDFVADWGLSPRDRVRIFH